MAEKKERKSEVKKDESLTKDSTAKDKGAGADGLYTREDVKRFVSDISKRILESNSGYLHSLITLNTLLRLPNAEDLLDVELKNQLRDLWTKLKSTGLQITDPPILFGVPELSLEEKTLPEPNEDSYNADAVHMTKAS